jgi:hypothetical protein
VKSGPHTLVRTPTVSEPPDPDLRLRLKPDARATGFADGAWWPRSRDLAVELPAGLAGLAARLGRIRRVSYNLGGWAAVDGQVEVGGRLVRLGGFRFQGADTVDVIDADRGRIILMVVPPATAPDIARSVSMTAASQDNVDRVSDLLAGVR